MVHPKGCTFSCKCFIKNGNEEKVFTANENLQLSDEEIVTLKLGGYFLNEEKLAKGWKIWTIEIK